MPFNEPKFRQLISSTIDLENPDSGVLFAKQALEMAKQQESLRIEIEGRLAVVMALSIAGSPDLAIPDFVWCMGKIREESEVQDMVKELQPAFDLLLGMSNGLTSLTAEQFGQMFDEFSEMSREAGHSLAKSHYLRMKLAARQGKRADYQTAKNAYLQSDQKMLLTCPACVQNTRVELAFSLGQYDEALDLAAPILIGEMKCREVPAITYGWVLHSLVQKGSLETAEKYHQIGLQNMSPMPRLLDEYAPHVSYLVWARRWQDLNPLVNECLRWCDEISSDYACLRFLYAVRPMCEHCPADEMQVELLDGSKVNPASFATFLDSEIARYASALNQSNGTRYASTEMKEPFQFSN